MNFRSMRMKVALVKEISNTKIGVFSCSGFNIPIPEMALSINT